MTTLANGTRDDVETLRKDSSERYLLEFGATTSGF